MPAGVPVSDGAPMTPAEITTARALMAEARSELGLLVHAGVGSLASCFASAVAGEAQLGAATAGEVVIAAVEQPGCDLIFITASRGGVPFAAITLTAAEAFGVAMQVSEILNRRSTPQQKE